MPRFGLSVAADEEEESLGSPMFSLRRPNNTGPSPLLQQQHTPLASSAGFSSPLTSPNTPLMTETNTPPQPSDSVNLSVRSPEGRQWHSLVQNDQGHYRIWSRRCEEAPTELKPRASSSSTSTIPTLLETVLPSAAQRSLALDPPLAMICVAAEGNDLTKIVSHNSNNKQKSTSNPTILMGLPRLCIYSSTAVFLIQIAFDPYWEDNAAETDMAAHPYGAVTGKLVSVHEPLERYFLQQSAGIRILRIRPAPQRYLGNAVHSPAGALCVLTHDPTHSEYQLVSLEASGKIKDPAFSFRTEELVGGGDDYGNRIVDFCFGQSLGLPLLSSMAVLLLKASGDVLAASPFVFDGTLVPRTIVEESLQFLQTGLDRMDRSEPQWRQYRAAQQFVMDVFSTTTSNANINQSHFVTAKVTPRGARETAAAFPIKIQGPILFHTDAPEGNDDDGEHKEHDNDTASPDRAVTIEPFGSSDLVGFCVATRRGRVDFGVTAPTTILPRFAFESRNDSYALDDEFFHSSAWVEKLDLDLEDATSTSSMTSRNGTKQTQSLALVRDPNVDTVVHVISPNLVAAISTNTVRAASVLVREGQPRIDPSTHVWSSMEHTSSSTTKVTGVVTLADEVSGHKLVVQMSDCDNVQEFNVSEAKATQEMQAIMASTSPQKKALLLLEAPGTPVTESAKATLQSLDAIPPFHQTAMPHVEKVNQGLGKLAKLVGSDTKYKDITPDFLAVVAAIQQRCEEEVVIPAMELASVTKIRRAALQNVIQEQTAQIRTLLEMRAEMEARNAKIQASLAAAEENTVTLRERTNAARDKCNALVPTVTDAELAYFQFVEAVNIKSEKWEAKAKETTEAIRDQCDKLNAQTPVFTSDMLDEALSANLGKINADTKRKLINVRQTLKETEQRLHSVLIRAGLEAPSENVPANVDHNNNN